MSLLLAFCAGAASAQPYFFDLNAVPPGENDAANPVVETGIPAGTYVVTFLGMADGGLYDAWNAWGTVTGCDGAGANCSTGWIHVFTCSVPGVGDVTVNPMFARWQTPALALANAPTGLTFTADAGDLSCWIPDTNYADNLGGASFRLDRQPAVTEVPTLSEWGLIAFVLLLLTGGLVIVRRRLS